MKKIPLENSDKFAIVDDDDFAVLSTKRWRLENNKYVVSGSGINIVKMHRVIMNTPRGMETDHINGDKLDNRKTNLRIATTSQNQMNRSAQKNNSTGYKGVRKAKKNYDAKIQCNRKSIHLGTFETAEEAARAYDKKARELFGEYARLNFEN